MKHVIAIILSCLLTVFLLPLLVVALVPANAGMIVSLVLFFAIDPAIAILLGIFSGFEIKRRWCLPLVMAISFLLSEWMFFEMGERVFLLYAVAYLLIGMLAMMLTAMGKRKIG